MTLTHVVMCICIFIYIDDSISHSILTMICISCLILIDLVTEERITAIPLVAILPIATKPIFQVTPLLARSAAALKLTPALIQVDADANQVQIVCKYEKSNLGGSCNRCTNADILALSNPTSVCYACQPCIDGCAGDATCILDCAEVSCRK